MQSGPERSARRIFAFTISSDMLTSPLTWFIAFGSGAPPTLGPRPKWSAQPAPVNPRVARLAPAIDSTNLRREIGALGGLLFASSTDMRQWTSMWTSRRRYGGGRDAGLTIRAAICRFLPRRAPVLAAPAARAEPDEAAKGPRERRLVAEAGLARDVDEGSVGGREQLLRALDPALGQPPVAAHPEARLEGAREVADRQLACLRHVREANGPAELLAQELGRPSPLPWREPAGNQHATRPRRSVALHDVGADEQLQVVEGEGGHPGISTEDRQDALGELREDHVVLCDREPDTADGFVAEIGGGFVDRCPANVEVDIVDAASAPHRGLRVEIDHVRVKSGDRSRRDDRTVDPELIGGGRHGPHEHRDEQGGHARRLVDRAGEGTGRLDAGD